MPLPTDNEYYYRLKGIPSQDGDVEIVEINVDDDGKVKSEDLSKRIPHARDVDRIKYTRQFRRLKDITQVARAGESYLYHDRLNHSLKVAQVGRRLAEYILETEDGSDILSREIDPDLIEAACLAHDLGHPPFGHVSESTLDDLIQEKTNPHHPGNDMESPDLDIDLDSDEIDELDGYLRIKTGSIPGLRFEGNAQTFRILTRLASHREAHTGLGLTLGVLLGIEKYPYGRGEWVSEEFSNVDEIEDWDEEDLVAQGKFKDKFGYYEADRKIHEEIRTAAKPGVIAENGRTAAAGIMDYADDLTYAIHDLTDFYIDGRLPLDRLLREAIGELDEEDRKGIGEEGEEYEQAPRRELEKLHEKLDYDESIETPTGVVTSLISTAAITRDAASLLEPYEDTPKQRDAIEAFTSFLVEIFLNRVYTSENVDIENTGESERYLTVIEEDGGCRLVISKRLQEQISILQQITRYYVIHQPVMMAQQMGEERIIKDLFEALYNETEGENLEESPIPRPYRSWIEEDSVYVENLDSDNERRARVVADFIASLTEPQAFRLHKRITGIAPGSLQDDIIR